MLNKLLHIHVTFLSIVLKYQKLHKLQVNISLFENYSCRC